MWKKTKKGVFGSKKGSVRWKTGMYLLEGEKYFPEVFDKRGFGTIIGRGNIYPLEKVWKP